MPYKATSRSHVDSLGVPVGPCRRMWWDADFSSLEQIILKGEIRWGRPRPANTSVGKGVPTGGRNAVTWVGGSTKINSHRGRGEAADPTQIVTQIHRENQGKGERDPHFCGGNYVNPEVNPSVSVNLEDTGINGPVGLVVGVYEDRRSGSLTTGFQKERSGLRNVSRYNPTEPTQEKGLSSPERAKGCRDDLHQRHRTSEEKRLRVLGKGRRGHLVMKRIADKRRSGWRSNQVNACPEVIRIEGTREPRMGAIVGEAGNFEVFERIKPPHARRRVQNQAGFIIANLEHSDFTEISKGIVVKMDGKTPGVEKAVPWHVKTDPTAFVSALLRPRTTHVSGLMVTSNQPQIASKFQEGWTKVSESLKCRSFTVSVIKW
ncbi:hypothetical protein B0H13DRAFT_1866041 [Mycena leptocephala]|nr:hypothetical protein B0H13DRAFT_1866041 [Mycena leptocephala]